MWYVIYMQKNYKSCNLKTFIKLGNSCLISPMLQISEKQKSLYEALEKQQRYQGSLQSISVRMESVEASLNEPPLYDRSPDRQMILHQVSDCIL